MCIYFLQQDDEILVSLKEFIKNNPLDKKYKQYFGKSLIIPGNPGSGVPKGTIPWNKNKKNYKIHNVKSREKLSKHSSCESNPRSKLSNIQVQEILQIYDKKPFIDNVGKIMKNGIPLSYDRAFSKKYCVIYNVTPENITRIIKKISWKKLEKNNVLRK